MSVVTLVREGSLAIVRYDRGGKANALNRAVIEALIQVARELSEDLSVQAVILTGAPAVFCGGIDLADPALWNGEDPLATQEALARGAVMCRAWMALPQLTVAAIDGPAVGGGAVLAMACDWRVMGGAAYLRLPEVRLGLPLAWDGLPRLTALAGPARAKRLLFSDLRLDAGQAQAWGLCEAVVPAGQALAGARDLAADARACPPLALRMTKRAIDAQCDAPALAHGQSDQFLLCHLLSRERAAA